MSEEGGGKTRGVSGAAGEHSSHLPPNYYYGTFQGVANYQPQPPPPSHLVMGIPQPVPPPAFSGPPPMYYPPGYQALPTYTIVEGRPYREERLPCCGVGLGWFLFIVGFFMGAIPWYIGAFLLLCVRLDDREKPGLVACSIAGNSAGFICWTLFMCVYNITTMIVDAHRSLTHAILAALAVTLGVTRVTHSW